MEAVAAAVAEVCSVQWCMSMLYDLGHSPGGREPQPWLLCSHYCIRLDNLLLQHLLQLP